jgi:UTP--glucose-1-phosphate uridylyltransferase
VPHVSKTLTISKVPRSRFLPVKKTDDLLLIQSNLYELRSGMLSMNPARKLPSTPLVKVCGERMMVASFVF